MRGGAKVAAGLRGAIYRSRGGRWASGGLTSIDGHQGHYFFYWPPLWGLRRWLRGRGTVGESWGSNYERAHMGRGQGPASDAVGFGRVREVGGGPVLGLASLDELRARPRAGERGGESGLGIFDEARALGFG